MLLVSMKRHFLDTSGIQIQLDRLTDILQRLLPGMSLRPAALQRRGLRYEITVFAALDDYRGESWLEGVGQRPVNSRAQMLAVKPFGAGVHR